MNDKYIDISDNLGHLTHAVNSARVFLESYNDKLDHMMGLFLDAEAKLYKAEALCKELQEMLDKD